MNDDLTTPVAQEELDISIEHSDLSLERSAQIASLSLKEAALILGKSMRALERSLSGKWGNRLPDGWTARKQIVDGEEQWRVLPPPEFKVDHLLAEIRKNGGRSLKEEFIASFQKDTGGSSQRSIWSKGANELVLGRPLEIVQLLRELAIAHKTLAEEQRAHMEDLRLLSEVQSSMRLLQVNATDTAQLKSELLEAQKDLVDLKTSYLELLNMPWWMRIFKKMP